MDLLATMLVGSGFWLAVSALAVWARARPIQPGPVLLLASLLAAGLFRFASVPGAPVARLAGGLEGIVAGLLFALAASAARPAWAWVGGAVLPVAFGGWALMGSGGDWLAGAAAVAALALARGRPWERWTSCGLAAVAFAVAAGAGGVAGGLGAILAVAAFMRLAFPRPGVRPAALAAAALAGAVPAAASIWMPDAIAAAWLAPPTFVVLGLARPAAAAAANRALAGAAGTMAIWATLPRLVAVHAGFTFAAGLLAGTAAAVAVEAAFPRIRPAAGSPRAKGNITQEVADDEAPRREGSVILGRFRVVRHLGDGGAGRAYLADDLVAGGRRVVKVPRTAAAADGLVAREAKALAAIKHGNVVRVDGVEHEGIDTVLVMEYVPGGSLEARLAAGPLAPGDFLRIARGLLLALDAVHEAGFVHQDVKPSNVLLGEDGRAILADFGVARTWSAGATMATSPSGWHVPTGTIRYMSPEQARGRSPSHLTDLYSAAATLFEAWSGAPYLEVRPNETAVELQLRAAADRRFDAPIDPPALRAWFARGLAGDPYGRFSSARAMREALEAALAGVAPKTTDPGVAATGCKRPR